jgi:RNA polymerase sigma-70 factor (ECF subfamily)
MTYPALQLETDGAGPTPRPDDRARFEAIVAAHHRRLRRVAAAVTADPNAVDDVLQEAYYRAYRKLPHRFDGADGAIRWLYRIVYNCAIDEVRRRARRAELVTAEVSLTIVGDDAFRRLAERDAFRTLAPGDRAVLLLIDDLGFDYAAAAAVLRVPRGTLAWRLSRARRRFQEALDA